MFSFFSKKNIDPNSKRAKKNDAFMNPYPEEAKDQKDAEQHQEEITIEESVIPPEENVIEAVQHVSGKIDTSKVMDITNNVEAEKKSSLKTHEIEHPTSENNETEKERQGWMARLSSGLKRTGRSLTEVFTGTQIDDDLYEELETALLLSDAGTSATEYLLENVKKRVKETKTTDPRAVRDLLAKSLTELLTPLEAPLQIGQYTPTVMMVSGVNGAGKTTSIGKLTRHLANSGCKVLLAAGDTFRAAAREQLEVWADRNQVEIVSQEGGDPASVSFDAVAAGKARKADVVIVDTAGRLATQSHLMDELKKVRRVISKAMESAPHEVLLVVDGNTGQNALAQVKAFDEAIQLTGLIVTKLDGTAKGGVIAAIALWSAEREKNELPPLPIYFIGVGEQVEDLQTFNANEFTQALLHT